MEIILSFLAIIFVLTVMVKILSSPVFWAIVICFALFKTVKAIKKIDEDEIEKEREEKNRTIREEKQVWIDFENVIKQILSAKQREARTRLQFMCFDELWEIDGFEFEDYFSEQLNNISIKNQPNKKTGDFGVDILVYGEQDYAVQLKHYKVSTVGVSAVQEVFTGAMYYGDIVPVILTTGKYTRAAVELAEATNVELINQTDIAQWHNSNYKRAHNHVEGGLYREIQDSLEVKLST